MIPTKRQMRGINERVTDAGASLQFWMAECARYGLTKTSRAIAEATAVLVAEVIEARNSFDNSGRRPKNRKAKP